MTNQIKVIKCNERGGEAVARVGGKRLRLKVKFKDGPCEPPLAPITIGGKSYEVKTKGKNFVVTGPGLDKPLVIETDTELPENLDAVMGAGVVIGLGVMVGVVAFLVGVLVGVTVVLVESVLEISCGGNECNVEATEDTKADSK